MRSSVHRSSLRSAWPSAAASAFDVDGVRASGLGVAADVVVGVVVLARAAGLRLDCARERAGEWRRGRGMGQKLRTYAPPRVAVHELSRSTLVLTS